MGMSSYICLVCGRDMMSDPKETYCYDKTPAWMRDVVVFMPDGIKLEGEYTGYQSVKTNGTIWSKWTHRKSRDEDCVDSDQLANGVSCIMVDGGEDNFDKEKQKDDHGYFTMLMREDHAIYAPCCYHRACWEAVGAPEGYRGPSIYATDQGFGSGGSLYMTNGFEGWEEHDSPCTPPSPGPEAIALWAVNSVCHFIYTIGSWARAYDHAEHEREMWRRLDEIAELVKASDELLSDSTLPPENDSSTT